MKSFGDATNCCVFETSQGLILTHPICRHDGRRGIDCADAKVLCNGLLYVNYDAHPVYPRWNLLWVSAN